MQKSFEQICGRIGAAAGNCGRDASGIRLVAVSKTKPVSDIQTIYECGHYIQELVDKAPQLPGDVKWHFIGGLQSNKIKQLLTVPNLWAVESVDSIKKADLLDKHWNPSKDRLNVFVQVNTSKEESKSGVSPGDCLGLCEHIKNRCKNLTLKGLMTIGAAEQQIIDGKNPDFTCLAELAREIGEKLSIQLELSMGMSDDFELAIRQGSTNVRVGSSIFGARQYPPKQ